MHRITTTGTAALSGLLPPVWVRVAARGAFPSSVYLELYIDGSFVTAAEADGLIIATPR
jgi:hypothetical protein